jgi:uncharacterized repeat protein (TIGR01451 family)
MRTRKASANHRYFRRMVRFCLGEVGSGRGVRFSALGLLRLVLFVALSLLGLSGSVFSRHLRVSAFAEEINTFSAADCTTPQTSWDLGQTACAVANDAPADSRIAWVAPDGTVAQITDFFAGTLSDSFTLPTGSDPLAQVGTWTVTVVDPSGSVSAEAAFVVRDPANASANLTVSVFGPTQVVAGSNANFRIEVTNNGPDDALTVNLTNAVPGNTTFVSEIQDSGLGFSCTSPSPGSTSGNVVCSIAALHPGELAVFTLTLNVTAGTPNGSTISEIAILSSATNELHQPDNTGTFSSLVASSSSGCSVSCPPSISVGNDLNQCGAVVTYTTPTATGVCAPNPEGGSNSVTCNPPSGSMFPIGATAVNCSALSGDSCSFTVTVTDSRPPVQPTISCPGDISTIEEFAGAGVATVTYPAPGTSGNCVKVVCDRPSGSRFTVGSTTVSCTGTDSSNTSVSCSFTVTVNTGTCAVTCPGDVVQLTPAGLCAATVSYSDPSTVGTCGMVTCSPPSGSSFPVGATEVNCSSTEGPTCSFTVTVFETTPPTITTCASNKTVVANANDEGVIPSLTGEVVATDNCSPIVVSQSPVAGTVVGLGDTTVTITVEDSSGNRATCAAIVHVVYDFAGFFPPISNEPVINNVQAGRAVPIKFSLNGDKGLDILAPGYPQSGTIPCDLNAPVVDVEQTVTAGESSLSYDPTTDTYTYVWKTKNNWAGTCRDLNMKLKDGSEHHATFKFR